MFCKNCGKEVNDNTAFCPECGAVVNPSANSGYEGETIITTGFEGPGAPVPPIAPQTPKKKKLSGSAVAIIILSVLLVAAAAVITIILLNNKNNENAGNKSDNTTKALEVLSQQKDYPSAEETTGGESVTASPEESTPVIEGTNESSEKVTEDFITKPSVTNSPPATKPAVTTKPQNQGTVNPNMTTDEILKLYNNSTANTVLKKPGYIKTRSITSTGYEADAVLSAFRDEIFRILGVGSANVFQEKVSKGTTTNDSSCGSYLRKSTLTKSDISSASISTSGSNYVVTINVKGGSSYIEGGSKASNNSPVDKTGICTGNTDKTGFDHKNASLIYNAFIDIAPAAIISESTSNCKIVATITRDGTLTNLAISWDNKINLSKFYGSTGTFNGYTKVTYSDFVY